MVAIPHCGFVWNVERKDPRCFRYFRRGNWLPRAAFLICICLGIMCWRRARRSSLLLIYGDGAYIERKTSDRPQDYKDMLKLLRWYNAGDHVWQYGASTLLDTSRTSVCAEGLEKCVHLRRAYGRAVGYLPTANMLVETGTFETRRQTMLAIAATLQAHSVPILLIGTGTQGEFTRNLSRRDISSGKIDLSPESYNLSREGQSLLDQLNRLSLPILLRGRFSVDVARRYGVKRALESGCPSLMINGDVNMGRKLQRKYQKLSHKINDDSLRMAINIKPHQPVLLEFYVNVSTAFPESIFFAQESNDVRALRDCGVPIERIRAHRSYEDWRTDVCQMDVAIGSRIHGNMAALGCQNAVPVFVIAPDFRVLELCESMGLPHTTIYDDGLVDGVSWLKNRLANIEFDGANFDERRCQKAQQYVEVFDSFGLTASRKLLRISESCPVSSRQNNGLP